MNELPPLGTTVRYSGPDPRGQGATGVVRRHIPTYPDPDRPHDIGPVEQWEVLVELNPLPRNWPSLSREFIARVCELEPAPARRDRYMPKRRFSAGRS